MPNARSASGGLERRTPRAARNGWPKANGTIQWIVPSDERAAGPAVQQARFALRGKLERVKGIEPSYAAWEAAVLPLNYTRTCRCLYHTACAFARRLARARRVCRSKWSTGPFRPASLDRSKPIELHPHLVVLVPYRRSFRPAPRPSLGRLSLEMVSPDHFVAAIRPGFVRPGQARASIPRAAAPCPAPFPSAPPPGRRPHCR